LGVTIGSAGDTIDAVVVNGLSIAQREGSADEPIMRVVRELRGVIIGVGDRSWLALRAYSPKSQSAYWI